MPRPAQLALAALFAALPMAAAAGPATCVTTQEGRYPCNFEQFGGDGSFTISARGKPTYTLSMTAWGVAQAVLNIDGHGVGLPGPYIRDSDEPACWEQQDGDARICVY